MSQINIRKEDKTSGIQKQARSEKLKEIDALYKAQIKQIYTDNKNKIEKKDVEQKPALINQDKKQVISKDSIIANLRVPILAASSSRVQNLPVPSTFLRVNHRVNC